LTVNVLLRELEYFNGIVIFATNLAANFDPAFERRIRTHVLFEMPGLEERIQIWKLQLHPTKTPLASDVDFRRLAERYAVSGGDIKNAVLKAASSAAAEPGPDLDKKISQRHFETAMDDVIAAHSIMQQSVFTDTAAALFQTPAPQISSSPPATETNNVTSNGPDIEPRWRTLIVLAAVLGGAAFLVSLLAVTLAFLR
jgi:ATP-dependent Zn protease